MAMGVAANRLELLQIADAVAREKSIDKTVVIHAMEEAMQRAAKSRYGSENEIKVEIDPKTGETHISRYLHVVENIENDKTEISIADSVEIYRGTFLRRDSSSHGLFEGHSCVPSQSWTRTTREAAIALESARRRGRVVPEN